MELLCYSAVGSAIRRQSILKKHRHSNGLKDSSGWSEQIDGCGGELAVAKGLNLYWSPGEGVFKAPDVAQYQVRCTGYSNPELWVRPDESDTDIFILVHRIDAMQFRLVGWETGRAVKDLGKLTDHGNGRPPIYYLSGSKLKGIDRLAEKRLQVNQ